VRLIASREAIDFVRERGGRLYVRLASGRT
jgi:hypothetical protein